MARSRQTHPHAHTDGQSRCQSAGTAYAAFIEWMIPSNPFNADRGSTNAKKHQREGHPRTVVTNTPNGKTTKWRQSQNHNLKAGPKPQPRERELSCGGHPPFRGQHRRRPSLRRSRRSRCTPTSSSIPWINGGGSRGRGSVKRKKGCVGSSIFAPWGTSCTRNLGVYRKIRDKRPT